MASVSRHYTQHARIIHARSLTTRTGEGVSRCGLNSVGAGGCLGNELLDDKNRLLDMPLMNMPCVGDKGVFKGSRKSTL